MYASSFKPTKNFLTRSIIGIVLFLSLWGLIVSPSVWAVGGDGTGGGTGAGGNIDTPLMLTKSSIASGQTDVPTDVVIQLDFNKNICNPKVADTNKDCFHLWAGDGEKIIVIPIVVTMPDDQVQKDYKDNVFISSQQPLEADTTYTLAIDNTLQAKNGTAAYNAYEIKFTTGSKPTEEVNPILSGLGEQNIQQYETALAPTEASVPEDKPPFVAEDRGSKARNTGLMQVIVVAIVAVVVISGVIVLSILYRRKQNNPEKG